MIRTAIKVFVFSIVSLPLTVLAQDIAAPPAGSPGCGNDAAKFGVKTDKGQQPTRPETGNALVYFIEDDSKFQSLPKPTTKAGVDGNWVGATHGDSYLFFSVDPGVHHLCASWQSSGSSPVAGALFGLGMGQVGVGQRGKVAASSFTAEAGGVYYFAVRNIFFQTEQSTVTDMTLTRLDNDEGQLLANKFAHSVSHQKK